VQDDLRCSVTFESVATRPWLRWERNACNEISVAELETELEHFKQNNDTKAAILSLTFNDIRPEQTLELGNLQLRQIFPDAFQIIPKRRTYSDRTFVQGIDANQFDSLDKVFADYLHSKYPEDEGLVNKLVTRAGKYFNVENP